MVPNPNKRTVPMFRGMSCEKDALGGNNKKTRSAYFNTLGAPIINLCHNFNICSYWSLKAPLLFFVNLVAYKPDFTSRWFRINKAG
jgi:hypothetical protein